MRRLGLAIGLEANRMQVQAIAASRRAVLGLATASLALVAAGRAARGERVATKARIVSIGTGAAGTAMANRLVERLEGATITLVDPRTEHLYQPGLSLVAAGLKPAGHVLPKTTDWLPAGVNLVAEAAVAIGAIAAVPFVFGITDSALRDMGGPIDMIVLLGLAALGAVGMGILVYTARSLLRPGCG